MSRAGAWSLRVVSNAAVATLYLLAARLGLSLGVTDQVSAVWPPTGIALAVVLLFGRRMWPGIWSGAFVANLWANEPLSTAAGIATGNTLESLCAAWLLHSGLLRVRFDAAMERLEDALALIVCAAIATIVAATIGVTSLCFGGIHPWSAFARLWGVWWLGDVMGALVVTPVLLVWWGRARPRWSRGEWAEFLALLSGLAVAASFVFLQSAESHPGTLALPYVVFPFLIWAALRFGQHGTTAVILIVAATATWGTATAHGPFWPAETRGGLLWLQAYLALVVATGLLLAGATADRERVERHHSVESAIARILAEDVTVAQAAARILEAICTGLGFDMGALWTVDRSAHVLRCADLWHRPDCAIPEFERASRARTFESGIGLPGRVWSSMQPALIENVVDDPNFPRARAAEHDGLHGAFGFPVVLEGEVLAVIELLRRNIMRPDPKLLQILTTVGSNVGQFIERKWAEEAIRVSEGRKAGMLASALDAIVTIDDQGRLLEFSRSAEQMFGHAVADVLGKEMALLIIPERLRARHRAGLDRCVRTGAATLLDNRVEMSAVRADGSEFPAELAVTRVIGSEPPLFTAYIRDITARKRDEEERARLLSDLREGQEARDRFIALLGHELRNPLAPVVNALEILRRRGGRDETTSELLALITRQVNHLTRLVDDLLDTSRIMRGKVVLQRQVLDLVELVRQGGEANRAIVESREHRLVVDVPDDPCWIVGDPTRMQQIISNLVNNAARYTPAGGEVVLALRCDAGAAELRVRDNGIGIVPDLLERVFEPFVQAGRVPGSLHEGLGLGLTLVKQLTELHGGTVRATSAGSGRGSEFVVHLPAHAAPGTDTELPPEAAAPTRRRRVLIVDDNEDSAETLAMMLELDGHETVIARDCATALMRFRQSEPEAVLLDIGLPGDVDGHEIAKRMLHERPDVLLVAVTGYGRPEDRQRSRETGFHAHLVKPVDARALHRILAADSTDVSA